MDLDKLKVRRSFIFTPGLHPEMFPKAIASGADMVCIELEDGIAINDKEQARKNTIEALKTLEVKNDVELVIRFNNQRTKFGLLDLEAFISSKVNLKAIMLPKVKTPDEITFIDDLLTDCNLDTDLHVIMETNEALENIYNIAHASKRIVALYFGGVDMAAELSKFPGLVGQDLAKLVSTKKIYDWNEGSIHLNGKKINKPRHEFKVIAYDFGIKQNILRILKDLGCTIKVIPATFSAEEALEHNPDGIFLSNGPGDPEACHYAVKNIKELLKHKIPIFGICLGFQLLGISVGGKAMKMKFGHHGANHPVIDLETKKVLITSQNHGFMIDEKSLPSNIRLTHRSLFDDSLQGIELPDCYAYGFQGHPEASPGPHDIHHIFNKFINFMKESKNA